MEIVYIVKLLHYHGYFNNQLTIDSIKIDKKRNPRISTLNQKLYAARHTPPDDLINPQKSKLKSKLIDLSITKFIESTVNNKQVPNNEEFIMRCQNGNMRSLKLDKNKIKNMI